MHRIKWRCGFLVLVLLLIAGPGIAADPSGLIASQGWRVPLKAGSGCTGGLQYDDGTFEDGYGFTSAALFGTYVMRFDFPSPGMTLKAVCVCWSKIATNATLFHGLDIWDASGPGGGPGTLIQHVAAANVSGIGTNPTFHRIELGAGVTLPTSSVYIGPTWFPSIDTNFFVCADENGSGTQPAYIGSGLSAPTSRLGTASIFPSYRALGIRAEADAPSGACIPSDTALCLNQGRFKVEATFQASGQPVGTAKVVKLTDETGYFWFFSSTNVEAVVKVLNGCGVNQRYWVFAGGLTNVQVTLTVTDTEDGSSKTYTNPINTSFKPIQDTGAFATCP